MKKSYLAFISISFFCSAYGSEFLVPSLQDESWVRGPKPLLKKEDFTTPSLKKEELANIPKEIMLDEPVILIDENGAFYESYSPEDALPDAPKAEPEIREAFEKNNTYTAMNEEENRFLQSDMFFSAQFDYANPNLSQENKAIADQIIEIMLKNSGQPHQQRLDIITAKDSSATTKLKTSKFIRYLKEAGLDESRIRVSLAQKDQATLLQENTILLIIRQTLSQ